MDQGFKDEVIIHGALLDITVEVVRRNLNDRGKGASSHSPSGGWLSRSTAR
ncbi:hypothetical protein STRIP9103_09607 [Streptomyces ipomoeae 91-03]|uniref:Uncharacterized protein n=1 Tax=Streptomyces ipomoeae 91-03 TaxID=698759 RepID=L1L496_9ACTN|nr:hypothetical protein STRIP9103_09607 [Streptomyces ipomoeae 91-03]MDX2693242.1 hypothetical protein [Streptomyces ipomoeae]